MIPRNDYLDSLINLRDKQIIKVVTGIRRCGKSTLFELFQEYLLQNGVEPEQIITFNLEDGDYADIEDNKALYNLVRERLLPDKMNYIFLDEVQRVEDFQKAVDGLFIKKNCDVYIQAPTPTCFLANWQPCCLGAMWKSKCYHFPSRSMFPLSRRTATKIGCTSSIFTTVLFPTRWNSNGQKTSGNISKVSMTPLF